MSTYELLCGDACAMLGTLDAGSVQTCVTSPPYFGLRDYGTASWLGGDPACDHRFFKGGRGDASAKQTTSAGTQGYQYSNACGKCGATRVDQQIGLEDTPDAFVARLVAVFREVRRVLQPDGTLWVNMGDSYATNGISGPQGASGQRAGRTFTAEAMPAKVPSGCKPKDLIGTPWLLAFALRADGWYLRSDIIWSKPNPMPESVTDRPTKAHEYIFLLSKSDRYYYDAAAIAEPATYAGKLVTLGEKSLSRGQANGAGITPSGNGTAESVTVADTRNKRSVWEVATQPYAKAHFATFPPKLIEPCILAGSRRGDLVLDPFNGSGTTGAVALKHGRRYVGIELNPEYIALAHERIGPVAAQRSLFDEVAS